MTRTCCLTRHRALGHLLRQLCSAIFTMDLDYRIQSLPVTGLFCRLRTFRPMGNTRDARPGAGLRIRVVPSKSKALPTHHIIFHILGHNQPYSKGPCRGSLHLDHLAVSAPGEHQQSGCPIAQSDKRYHIYNLFVHLDCC